MRHGRALGFCGRNPNGIYNSSMNSQYGCWITWNTSLLKYDFSGHPSGEESDWSNRPVNYVSWYDAARYCNWLTTGDTETGACTFSGGTLQSYLNHQTAGEDSQPEPFFED